MSTLRATETYPTNHQDAQRRASGTDADNAINHPEDSSVSIGTNRPPATEDKRSDRGPSQVDENSPTIQPDNSITDFSRDPENKTRSSEPSTILSETTNYTSDEPLQIDSTTDQGLVARHPPQLAIVNRNRSAPTTKQPEKVVSTQKRIPGRKNGAKFRGNNAATARSKIPQEMQAQWRIGAAPSVALALSKEDSQVAKVILQAQTFHTSMFESVWGPHMQANQFVFDLDNRIELFRDSSVTATCLVAANKTQSAQVVLDRILPGMDRVLKDQHPQLYLILAELSLGLVQTPNNALRDQIAGYLAARARMVLGAEHPITSLLTLQLPTSRKEILGQKIWERVLPILLQTFGPDHYQCSTQIFCQARNFAACGRYDEAIASIEKLIEQWSQLYGANSLIVCYSKIELANILARAGSNMKAEFVISDALRTTDIIQAAELRNEDCHTSEKRHRAASIAFPKIAGYRTLGKLHRIRGNLGAAKYHYSQAVAIGIAALGENNPAVELAQNELDVIRELERKEMLERFSPADLSTTTDIVGSPVVY